MAYRISKYSRKIFLFLFILSITSFLFAQEPKPESGEAAESQDLSELQKQARIYRQEGFRLQGIGNLEAALSLYQKAIELDPAYAVAYSDLGVVYETKGILDKAEESYLRAIKIDPNYLSAYSNLALLYESKRDLENAYFYWEKRAKLGSPDEPWSQKARQRLDDINLALGKTGVIQPREQEVIGLIKDVVNEKDILRQDNKALTNKHFEKAKRSYNKGDYAQAIKEALDGQQLDPSNKDIEEFIEKTQLRALSE